jgi:hypothetical protein
MPPSNRVKIHWLLRSVDYPADKAELMRAAERNGADEMALHALGSIEDRTYASAEDLRAAVDTDIDPSAAGSGPRGLSSRGDDTGEHPSLQNPPR